MRKVNVKKMKVMWVETLREKVVDTSPLWVFTDEDGHTIIQVPSKKRPTKLLQQLRNENI